MARQTQRRPRRRVGPARAQQCLNLKQAGVRRPNIDSLHRHQFTNISLQQTTNHRPQAKHRQVRLQQDKLDSWEKEELSH